MVGTLPSFIFLPLCFTLRRRSVSLVASTSGSAFFEGVIFSINRLAAEAGFRKKIPHTLHRGTLKTFKRELLLVLRVRPLAYLQNFNS